jgi:hypothetical protein
MTGFVSKKAMANSREGTPTPFKSNSMASTVSHTENCLYGEFFDTIEAQGTPEQKAELSKALEALESLYFLLREDE